MASSAPRERTLRTGDVVEGRYRILEVLGAGGMGTVFLAEHTLIKRRVAIKVLHPELATDPNVIERFMNEARAAGTLGHPNIVESTDMGFTAEAVPYIVFEYLEGTLLTEEIYRVGGLSVRRAVRVAMQIASALHAAHNAEIVHRDLKSDNVFLTDKDDALDHVKVLDFGISRFLALDDEQTKRGMMMGTPEFMAPEQITTPSLVDHRADIYALGVILYEMLTARRPYATGDDPRQLLHRIVHTEPPPLDRAEVPRDLAELVMTRMLAKNPADRYQSMRDVEAALDSFNTRIRGLTGPIAVDYSRTDQIPRAVNVTHTPFDPEPARRRAPWLVYGVGALGLAVGVAGLVFGYGGNSGASPDDPPVAAAVPPAPDPASTQPAPAAAPVVLPPPTKVEIRLAANAPDARVTFRRRVIAAPATMQLTPSDIVELVEISAPGHRSTRYWLTFDRPTQLVARLVRGTGSVEASEQETLVALGEASPGPEVAETPAATAPTTATATAQTPRPPTRRIGRATGRPAAVSTTTTTTVATTAPTPATPDDGAAAGSAEPATVGSGSGASPATDVGAATASPTEAPPSGSGSGSAAPAADDDDIYRTR